MRVNCTNLTNEAAPALLADRYGVTFTSIGGPVDELAYLLLAGTDHWDPDEVSRVVRQVVDAISVHGHAAVQRGSTHRTAASPDGPFGLRAAFWAGWRVLLADGRYFLRVAGDRVWYQRQRAPLQPAGDRGAARADPGGRGGQGPGSEGELMAVRRYTTMRDVIEQEVIPALGEYVDDYDVKAIAQEAFTYRVDTNEQGDELLNTAGFEQVVDVEEFWEIAAKHDRSNSQREDG